MMLPCCMSQQSNNRSCPFNPQQMGMEFSEPSTPPSFNQVPHSIMYPSNYRNMASCPCSSRQQSPQRAQQQYSQPPLTIVGPFEQSLPTSEAEPSSYGCGGCGAYANQPLLRSPTPNMCSSTQASRYDASSRSQTPCTPNCQAEASYPMQLPRTSPTQVSYPGNSSCLSAAVAPLPQMQSAMGQGCPCPMAESCMSAAVAPTPKPSPPPPPPPINKMCEMSLASVVPAPLMPSMPAIPSIESTSLGSLADSPCELSFEMCCDSSTHDLPDFGYITPIITPRSFYMEKCTQDDDEYYSLDSESSAEDLLAARKKCPQSEDCTVFYSPKSQDSGQSGPCSAAKRLFNAFKPSPCNAPKASPCNAPKPSPCGAAKASPCGAAKASPCGAAKPSPCGAAKPSPCGARAPSPCGAQKASPCGAPKPSLCGAQNVSQAGSIQPAKSRHSQILQLLEQLMMLISQEDSFAMSSPPSQVMKGDCHSKPQINNQGPCAQQAEVSQKPETGPCPCGSPCKSTCGQQGNQAEKPPSKPCVGPCAGPFARYNLSNQKLLESKSSLIQPIGAKDNNDCGKESSIKITFSPNMSRQCGVQNTDQMQTEMPQMGGMNLFIAPNMQCPSMCMMPMPSNTCSPIMSNFAHQPCSNDDYTPMSGNNECVCEPLSYIVDEEGTEMHENEEDDDVNEEILKIMSKACPVPCPCRKTKLLCDLNLDEYRMSRASPSQRGRSFGREKDIDETEEPTDVSEYVGENGKEFNGINEKPGSSRADTTQLIVQQLFDYTSEMPDGMADDECGQCAEELEEKPPECDCCHCRAMREIQDCCRDIAAPPDCTQKINCNELKFFIDSIIMDLEAMEHARRQKQLEQIACPPPKPPACPRASFPVTITDVTELGTSSLYVKWVIHDCFGIGGYEIYVDGYLTNRYFHCNHEAAVICEVDIMKPHKIALMAVPKSEEKNFSAILSACSSGKKNSNKSLVRKSEFASIKGNCPKPPSSLWTPSIYLYDPSQKRECKPAVKRCGGFC